MKVSVIIPCHSKHFHLLGALLSQFRNMTVFPNEIVISISGCKKIDPLRIETLELFNYPFALKILKHQEQFDPSDNRNFACRESTGDLLICQDADDWPHIQRVEIIKCLFENYKIDYLIHRFTLDPNEWQERYEIDAARFCTLRRDAVNETFVHVAQGCPAFTREVFSRVQWEPFPGGGAEDGWFNSRVAQVFERSVILSLPIYYYRLR